MNRRIDVDPTLAVRSSEPALDPWGPVLRLADVGLAVSFEAPAFARVIFPRDLVDDDLDLALAARAAGTFDGEGDRATLIELVGIWPVEESDAEVELGRGVDDVIARHTTLLSLNYLSVRWRTDLLPYLPPFGARDDLAIRPPPHL